MLRDTHLAAVDNQDGILVGVVRHPMYGLEEAVDLNIPELGPPESLLEDFKQVADQVGHNEAVDKVDFERRYEDHLLCVQHKIASIVDLLEDDHDVWLVCYENTNEKFCHRTLLKEHISDSLVANE